MISSFARASKILKGEQEGTQYYFPVVSTDVRCLIVSYRTSKMVNDYVYPPLFFFPVNVLRIINVRKKYKLTFEIISCFVIEPVSSAQVFIFI